MAYIPPNPNGQATSANSAPVVLANDQSAVPIIANGSVASGEADTGNPIKMGGVYKASTPTFADGQRADVQVDPNGNLKSTLATKLDPINDGITTYAFGHYISTVSTATTTNVVAFPCVITEIRVLGGTLGNIAVYDNNAASGSPIIPAFTPDKSQVLIGAATNFAVGCTIVTAAATIVTVIWRPS